MHKENKELEKTTAGAGNHNEKFFGITLMTLQKVVATKEDVIGDVSSHYIAPMIWQPWLGRDEELLHIFSLLGAIAELHCYNLVMDKSIERQDSVAPTANRKAWLRSEPTNLRCREMILYWTMASVVHPFHYISSKWKRVFILSCVAVSLDSLFLYIPIIDQEKTCLGVDKTLRTVALVFRSLTDLAFVMHIILLINNAMDDGPKWDDSNSDSDDPATALWLPRKVKLVREAIAKKMPWLSSSIMLNFLAVLPIPQVAIVFGFFSLGSSKHFLKQTVINVLLVFQYFLRVSQIFLSIEKVGETVGKWVKGSFYFLLYIIASQVLAAFWYLFSIQREISCWDQACQMTIGCMPIYDCGHSFSSRTKLLKKLCPIDTANETLFNFGMFLDMLKSGNTGSTKFSTKFLYSFWWGLRNLSNFGTNLETSSYMWENCFAIIICVIGLLLFLFLIGNVQTYIQSETEKFVKIGESRRTRINTKYKDIEKWMSRHGLPDDTKNDIWKNIREDKVVELIDQDVDTKFMESCYYRYKFKTDPLKFVCLNALKKIPILQNIDERDLKVFCEYRHYDYLDYVTKEKESYIIRAGEKLDAIYLIIDGVIECKAAETVGSSPIRSTPTMHRLYEYVGEEVLGWAILNYKHSYNYDLLPISTVDVKCQTEIRAFKFTENQVIKIFRTMNNSRKLEFLALALDDETDHLIKHQRTVRYEKFIEKMKIDKSNNILNWLVRYRFPEDLKASIMKSLNESNQVEESIDADVDLGFMFATLPEDIKSSTKRHLGLNALKKVPMLQKMDENVLEIICNYLKPVVYKENSYVVTAGEPVSLMIFILGGKIVMTDKTMSSPGTRSFSEIIETVCDENVLEVDSYYGEQLLSWTSPDDNISSFENPIISTRDVKCITKVEALILKAEDLRSAVSKCGSQWNLNSNIMNSQHSLVGNVRDFIEATSASTSPKMEQTRELHQSHDLLLETDHRIKHQRTVGYEKFVEKMKIDKPNNILNWLVRYELPEDLKASIMKILNENNQVEESMDADVDLGFMFATLPKDIKSSIKRHLGLNALKKVPMLQKMDENVLEIICNYLKPVVYKENSYVVTAGEPVSLMIFILGGKIVMTDRTMSSPGTRSFSEIIETVCDENVLDVDSYYGEQLLSWASADDISSFDNPIISTRDVKCLTKVEALILKAEDLRSAVSKCGSQWNLDSNIMNSQHSLVGNERDFIADISATTSPKMEQTRELHQGHDMLLEQLVLIRETMSQFRDDIVQKLDDQGRRLDDQRHRLDNQGERLDEMAAFLSNLGYKAGTSPAAAVAP